MLLADKISVWFLRWRYPGMGKMCTFGELSSFYQRNTSYGVLKCLKVSNFGNAPYSESPSFRGTGAMTDPHIPANTLIPHHDFISTGPSIHWIPKYFTFWERILSVRMSVDRPHTFRVQREWPPIRGDSTTAQPLRDKDTPPHPARPRRTIRTSSGQPPRSWRRCPCSTSDRRTVPYLRNAQ